MQLQANRSRSFSPQFGIPGVPGKGRCNRRNKGKRINQSGSTNRAVNRPAAVQDSIPEPNDHPEIPVLHDFGCACPLCVEGQPEPPILRDIVPEIANEGNAKIPTTLFGNVINWGDLESHTIPELRTIAANCIPPIKVPRVGKPAIIAAIQAALGSMDL